MFFLVLGDEKKQGGKLCVNENISVTLLGVAAVKSIRDCLKCRKSKY